MPPSDFDWPFYQKPKQKVYLRQNHISGPKYGCFKLSRQLQGLICVTCALFATECSTNDQGKCTSMGQLVQTPLRSYRSLTGSGSSLDCHLETQYHKTAQLFADNFIASMKTKKTVKTELDAEYKRQQENKRQRLVPIIKTYIGWTSGYCLQRSS
jgi:hypothetical protein